MELKDDMTIEDYKEYYEMSEKEFEHFRKWLFKRVMK